MREAMILCLGAAAWYGLAAVAMWVSSPRAAFVLLLITVGLLTWAEAKRA